MAKYSYLDLTQDREKRDWGKTKLQSFIKEEKVVEDFRIENFTKHMELDFSKYLSFILIFKAKEGDRQGNSTENQTENKTREPTENKTQELTENKTRELIGFASARLMPLWPNTVARVFNRLYISKALRLNRFGHFNRDRLDRCYEMSLPIYKKLLSACKLKGIKCVVTTRENTGGVNSISTVQQMLNRFDMEKKWEIYPNYVLTCKDSTKAVCWQRATFRFLDPDFDGSGPYFFKNERSLVDPHFDGVYSLLSSLPSLSQEEYAVKFPSSISQTGINF